MTDINPTTNDDSDLGPGKGDETTFGSFGYEDTETSGTDTVVTVTNQQQTTQSFDVGPVAHGDSNSATPNWSNCYQVQIAVTNSAEGQENFMVPPNPTTAISSLNFRHDSSGHGQYQLNNGSWIGVSKQQ